MLDMGDSKLEILRTIAKEAVAEVNGQLTFLKEKSVDVKGICKELDTHALPSWWATQGGPSLSKP